MKTLRRLAIALALCAVALPALAQSAADVNASRKRVLAAAAPCNTCAEPFREFIVKFNKDNAFMQSRIRLDKSLRERYAHLLKPGEVRAKKPFDVSGDEYYQCWGEASASKVFLDYGWVDSYVEYTLVFERDSDGWYLTRIIATE